MTVSRSEQAPRLSDQDLATVMSLLRGADSVELKLTVPTSEHRATIASLGLDPVEAQPRQVFFFDTPDLALERAGLVVRARRIQGGRGDTVVKLRPVVPEELPADIRRSTSFKVEVDVIPGGFVCSGSMKGGSSGQEIRDAVAGSFPLRKLFSKAQKAFYATHAPAGIEIDSLVPLGPTFILKAVFTPRQLGRRFVTEMWLYPDGSRVLELSTKCLPREAFQVAAEARSYLADRGVALGGAQQTKTKTAMAYFKAELEAEAAKKPVQGA